MSVRVAPQVSLERVGFEPRPWSCQTGEVDAFPTVTWGRAVAPPSVHGGREDWGESQRTPGEEAGGGGNARSPSNGGKDPFDTLEMTLCAKPTDNWEAGMVLDERMPNEEHFYQAESQTCVRPVHWEGACGGE